MGNTGTQDQATGGGASTQKTIFLAAPSGDVTGVTDRTALNAAITTLGGPTAGKGTIVLAPANQASPWYIDNGVDVVQTVGISLITWGDPSNCFVQGVGSAPSGFLSWHSFPNGGSASTGPQVGAVKGFTIDMTNATTVTSSIPAPTSFVGHNATAFVLAWSTPHGLLAGDTVVLAGFSPAAYNGTWFVDDVISSTEIRFMTCSVDVGAGVTLGTITLEQGPVGLHYGDTEWSEVDINVIGNQQLGSIGLLLNNWAYFCEKTRIQANIRGCQTQVQYNVNSGAGTGPANQSFDYGKHEFTVEVTPDCHGIWICNGATLDGLSLLSLTGNFNGSTSAGIPNHGSVIRCTGASTTTPGGTTGSQILAQTALYISVESDGTGIGHQTLTFGQFGGASTNTIQCQIAAANFASFGPAFVPSNANVTSGGNVGFISVEGAPVSDVNWYSSKASAANAGLTYSAVGVNYGGHMFSALVTVVYSVAPSGGTPQILLGTGITNSFTPPAVTPAGMALLTGVPYSFTVPVPANMNLIVFDNATTHGTATVTTVLTRMQ